MTLEKLTQLIIQFYGDPIVHSTTVQTALQSRPSLLVDLLKEKPHLIQNLKSKALDSFWSHFLNHFQPSDNKSIKLNPQPLLNKADIAIGYLYYTLSIDQKESNEERRADYCVKALTHHSYHALSHLIHTMIQQLGEGAFESAHARLTQCLNKYQNTFMYHGAPGFLLGAYAFYMAANTLDKVDSEELKATLMKQALHFICLAEYNLPISEAEINNAYLGHPFSLSHPFQAFKLYLVVDIKTFIKNEATTMLSQKEMTDVIDDAQRIHNQFEFGQPPLPPSFEEDTDDIKAILMGDTASMEESPDFS